MNTLRPVYGKKPIIVAPYILVKNVLKPISLAQCPYYSGEDNDACTLKKKMKGLEKWGLNTIFGLCIAPNIRSVFQYIHLVGALT